MALVITIAQQKGGAGKTMLAANLAAAFARSRRVALVDVDPQRSLSRWHGLRPGPAAGLTLSAISGWRLADELARLRQGFDMLIVDSPPQLEADARRAVRAADLVLAPVQASQPDLWAVEGTAAMARAEGRRMALVLNRAPTLANLRARALGMVALAGHAVLPAVLGNRAAFPNAFAQGLGVQEAGPRTAAAAEMDALAALLETMLPG